jgi:NADH:ubiquinone oxidoreductase subunit 5 (subunit L)/multisubunit Na+/H+ antiporter MnhA subunit
VIGIAGVVLMAISLYQIYDAVRGGYARDSKTEQMDPSQRTVFMVLGRVGLTARALVFGLIGYFLVRTAVEFNATNAIGVDGALAQLHHQPLGRWLVGVVAAGLLTFSVFSLVEARYRRL